MIKADIVIPRPIVRETIPSMGLLTDRIMYGHRVMADGQEAMATMPRSISGRRQASQMLLRLPSEKTLARLTSILPWLWAARYQAKSSPMLTLKTSLMYLLVHLTTPPANGYRALLPGKTVPILYAACRREVIASKQCPPITSILTLMNFIITPM